MCVPREYSSMIPLGWFIVFVISMILWTIYATKRAREACVDPLRYRNFFSKFLAVRQHPLGWVDWFQDKRELLFPIDERDAETLLRYRRILAAGNIVIFLVFFFGGSALEVWVPACADGG
jgi:hypothetical protein